MKITNRRWISRQELKAEIDRRRLNREMGSNNKKIQELKGRFNNLADRVSPEGVKLNKKINALVDRNEEIAKILDTITTYVDQSIEYKPCTPSGHGFSIADRSGRVPVDANSVGVTFDNYVETAIAETVEEGQESEDRRINATVLKTDTDDVVIFDDIVKVRTGAYYDNPEIAEVLIPNDHESAFIQAENKKAIEVLIGSKDAIHVSAENLQEAINDNLCAKAKKNAIILVNHSGFALLDVDINGVSLVTKDPEGRFIYKHKYEIQEVPDAILPNSETGDPIVIIGDIANVVKFFLIRDDALTFEIMEEFNTADREIRKEIVALRTTSDEAYIVGSLA